MKERNICAETAIIFRNGDGRLSFSLFTDTNEGANIIQELESNNYQIITTGSYEDAIRMTKSETYQNPR
jgi:hypothetical protein